MPRRARSALDIGQEIIDLSRMWTSEHGIETSATPERIWRLFADVDGWKRWNAGIQRIALHGPFAAGTTFTMQPPGMEPLTSRLIDVRENESFTDETVLGDVRVVVHHEIVPAASGRVRIVYRAEVEGGDAAEVGAQVTSDFHDVLAALKALAERE